MSSAHGEFPITPTESQTTGTVGNFPRGSRETPETSVSQEADRSEKARCRTSDVYVSGESDSSIVPKKRTNKGGLPTPAEPVEGRGLTEENQTVATGPDTAPGSRVARTAGRTSRGTPGFCPDVRRDRHHPR